MILKVGTTVREIGPLALLLGFYDTVGCRLEPSGRGSRFPLIMTELHEGRLSPASGNGALSELSEIETGLRHLPAAQVLMPSVTRKNAANALDCFASPDGNTLIAHLRAAIEDSVRSRQPIDVLDSDRGRGQSYAALGLFLLGAAWCLFGYALFPNWVVRSAVIPNDTGGLPIWQFGFAWMALGVAFGIAAALPGVRVWFARHQWAGATLAILLVLTWVALGAHH